MLCFNDPVTRIPLRTPTYQEHITENIVALQINTHNINKQQQQQRQQQLQNIPLMIKLFNAKKLNNIIAGADVLLC